MQGLKNDGKCTTCGKVEAKDCPECLARHCNACALDGIPCAMTAKRFKKILKLAPGLLTSHTRFCYNIDCANPTSSSAKMLACPCQKVSYCSKECQRADWKRCHKRECVGVKKESDE